MKKYYIFVKNNYYKKNMNLTLEIINKYKLPKEIWTPDYDDKGYEYTLPNGIILTTLFVCNNEPCKSDCLDGLDGWIYITTEEELKELINLNYEEVLSKIQLENEDFDIEKYLD